MGADFILVGPEAGLFAKPHKPFPTYTLTQKKLNKAKQNLMGNWSNYNRGWMEITVTYLKHIFQNGNLLPFVVLKERFNLLPIHAFLLPAVAARC